MNMKLVFWCVCMLIILASSISWSCYSGSCNMRQERIEVVQYYVLNYE